MAGRSQSRAVDTFASTATLLPVIVGALLVAIVAIFIFEAPNQITTPGETGYRNTEMPVAANGVYGTKG